MTAGRRINTTSVHWNTPPKFTIPIREFFGGIIDLDPCSNEESIVGANTELYEGGLEHDWNQHESIFVNPPYGRGIKDWLRKCHETDSEIIALIPVATNTTHWKEFIYKSDVICFLYDTRLKFMIGENTNNKGASMSCCLVYWGDRKEKFVQHFSKRYGECCVVIEKKNNFSRIK